MNENETVMSDEGRIYEISYILDSHLDQEGADKKLATLKQDIASLDGSFISEETPYLRELSYVMIRTVNHKKVRFSEGYFGWIKFEIEPANILTLEKKLKLDEEVVRFLVVKADQTNDVFTRDIEVIKSDPSIVSNLNEEDSEGVNLDTTNDENTEETITEEAKKELDKEISELDLNGGNQGNSEDIKDAQLEG